MNIASTKKTCIRFSRSIIRIVLGVLAGFALFLLFFQSRYIYFPEKELIVTPDVSNLAFENLSLNTADGQTINAWYIPCAKPRATVLFCHGNAGNISHRIDSINIFHNLNLNVLVFDYRGYGRSTGNPNEQGTYIDVETAWNYLVNEKQIAPESIIIFGRSLGGAVATNLAHKHQPGALIIESTFSSAKDMAADLFPFIPRFLVRYNYATKTIIGEISCPKLVIHSKNDEIIPFAHGQHLFSSASKPKIFLEISGTHNTGFLTSGSTYTDGLETFITSHF